MKTLIYSIIALCIISIYACSNSSGGGSNPVVPEEEAHPDIVGKWHKHDIYSDPRNIEYWHLSSTTNSLTTGLINLADTVYRRCKFVGTWNGNTFRGSYQRAVGDGTEFIGEFMQVTFTGSTMSGFTVDSTWQGNYPHTEFDGYKL